MPCTEGTVSTLNGRRVIRCGAAALTGERARLAVSRRTGEGPRLLVDARRREAPRARSGPDSGRSAAQPHSICATRAAGSVLALRSVPSATRKSGTMCRDLTPAAAPLADVNDAVRSIAAIRKLGRAPRPMTSGSKPHVMAGATQRAIDRRDGGQHLAQHHASTLRRGRSRKRG